jgi:hypothetical protein
MFGRVVVAKPKSSRSASIESFVVCQGFRAPNGFMPSFEAPNYLFQGGNAVAPANEATAAAPSGSVQSVMVPFLACGDLCGWDARMRIPAEASAVSGGAGAFPENALDDQMQRATGGTTTTPAGFANYLSLVSFKSG